MFKKGKRQKERHDEMMGAVADMQRRGRRAEVQAIVQEAAEAARAFRPEVVLLDIGLPRLNGYDACRAIRRQPWGERMVLIALTGWGQEEDKWRAAAAGFDHHLTKPVAPADLARLLVGLPMTPA